MNDEEKRTKSWWHTVPGMITAVATAIAAVVSMVLAVEKTNWFDHPNLPPARSDVCTSRPDSAGSAPSTAEIWQALESGDYQAAINKARICTTLCQATAREVQSVLAKTHEPDPPVGALSLPEAERILERYDLNTMATCLYILGEASVNLENIGDARNAYNRAIWHTYARDWDPPTKWFWSPAVAARCRVEKDLDSWDRGQHESFAAFLKHFNAARKDACRVQSQ